MIFLAISLDQMPRDEFQLMIRNVEPTARKVAKEYGARAGVIEILGHSGNRQIRPQFRINAKYDLNEARKLAFELVQKYRKAMAENKEIQEFYQIKRPEYDLKKKLFPLSKTNVSINFYENNTPCKKPYITKVIFKDQSFYYYTMTTDWDTFQCIFEESYADAEAYYTSQKAS